MEKQFFHRSAKIFFDEEIPDTFAESFVFAKNYSGHNFMKNRVQRVIRGSANFVAILASLSKANCCESSPKMEGGILCIIIFYWTKTMYRHLKQC